MIYQGDNFEDAKRYNGGLIKYSEAEGGNEYSNIFGITLGKKGKEAKEQAKSGDCSSFTKDTPLRGKTSLCVNGTPVYPGGGFVTLAQWEKTMNRCICQKRKEAKVQDDVAPVSVTDSPIPTPAPTPAPIGGGNNTRTAPSKSKKGLIIGGSIALVVLGIGAFLIFRKKTKK